ncbi:MAG: hypothetical protein IKX20_08765 [Paludibacteraceae bacterium]|nr:hypothetical protein [Paludibacteraceae bacterium]
MKEIKYTLRGVSIEQFATPFVPSSEDFDVNVSIPIKANYQERAIAIGANVQFFAEGRVFLIAEAFCHYQIEPNCWNKLSEDDSKEVVLPKGFINNLAGIAVSTVRGVLCARTENTPFAKYFLPLIMLDPKQGEDVKIAKPQAQKEGE